MIKTLLVLILAAGGLVAQTQHTVTVTWTDPNNPVGTSYNVYRATGQCSGSPAFTKVLGPVTGLTAVDSTVTLGAYCYYVTATNGTVESGPSPTAGTTVSPFAPTSVTLTVK